MFIKADDGVKLYVDISGNELSPVTVVLCHGFLSNSDVWQYHRKLLGTEVRVVTWDLRGHGESGIGKPENSTLEQLGRDLETVIEATTTKGKPVVVVGHSMGGIAVLFLEKVLSRVSAVMLCSTSSGELHSVTGGMPEALARGIRKIMPGLLKCVFSRTIWAETIRVAAFLPALSGFHYFLFATRLGITPRQVIADLSALNPTHQADQFWDSLKTLSARESLSRFSRTKTVIVVGTEDRVTPVEHSMVIKAALPEAKLEIIPGAGHMLIVEQPERITALILECVQECIQDGDGGYSDSYIVV